MYSREYAVLDGWDSGHRFAMEKYPRLFDRLVQRGVLSPSEVCEPADPAGNEWLHRAHSAEYVAGYCDGTLAPNAMRRIGLPWSPAMVRAVRLEVAGTLLAARLALSTGIACNLGGGTHHAQRAAGSGFNPFNDLAVASLALLAEGAARRVLVVDLDVHQGDGTAAILSEEPRAATFSMHAARAFPVRKQRSTVDVGLPNGTGDEEYLRLLREHLPPLLDEHRPDLVLYDAGSACAESASGRARGRDHPSPLLVHRRRLPRRGRGADLPRRLPRQEAHPPAARVKYVPIILVYRCRHRDAVNINPRREQAGAVLLRCNAMQLPHTTKCAGPFPAREFIARRLRVIHPICVASRLHGTCTRF